MDIQQLDSLYKLYHFQHLPVDDVRIRVYSFVTKYFSNADIILLKEIETGELGIIKNEIASLGFSVTVRNYRTIQDAKESLFDGFFDVKSSKKILEKSYFDYIDKIKDITFTESYQYIQTQYIDERNIVRTDNIVDTILNNLSEPGPVLILLEAAAGFGKTSTSYEVIKHFAKSEESSRIPLFTELSRNRQASIFKYVLYDEINNRFTGRSLELVTRNIQEGRIPVIIDGFDELLKNKSSDGIEKFEDAEPMLETIKELLSGETKILLTTRRTAIFSDDEFFKWLEESQLDFSFYRYSISDPNISDWISSTREKQLQKAGLNLKSISNPVLLAYLRSLNDTRFEEALSDIDIIINDYLEKLLERENTRQELIMSVDEQMRILKILSYHFTNHDITSDNKENIEKLIFEQERLLLYDVQNRYPSSKRPSVEQLINKLMIHACLDRKGDNDNQIGFVNDFMLGSFVGKNLLDQGDSWFGTERFVDFVLTAYLSRSEDTRRLIYEVLQKSLLDLLDEEKQIFIDNYMFGMINHDFSELFFSELEFRKNLNNNKTLRNCVFSDCEFHEIDFETELNQPHTEMLFFINCSFYNYRMTTEMIAAKSINFTNCSFTPDFSNDGIQEQEFTQEYIDPYQKKVLERFWQSGRDRFIPHKRHGTLRLGIPSEEIQFVDEAIKELIRKNYIIERRGQHSLELNINYLKEIKEILQR